MFVPWIPSGAVSPRWWVILVGAPMTLAFRKIAMTPGHWFFLTFMSYCVLTFLWSYPQAWWDQANALIILGGLFCVFLIAAEEETLPWDSFGIACAINSIFAVAQWEGYHLLNPLGGTVGLFLNRDVLAEFGVLSLFGLLMGGHFRWVPFALICALLPGSHAAYLTAVVGVLILLWREVSGLVFAAFLSVAAPIVVGIGAYEWLYDPNRFVSMSNRIDFWATTVVNLKWFGWGYGAYYWLFPWKFTHNEFLQFAFDLGLGALLLIPVVIYALKGTTSSAKLVLALLGTECLFSFSLHNPASAFIGAMCLGHLCGDRRRVLNREFEWRDLTQCCVPFPATLPAEYVRAYSQDREFVSSGPQYS